MEQNQPTYEDKRAEKERRREEARSAELHSRRGKKVRRYFIWLIIVAAIGYGIFLLVRSNAPEGRDFSQSFSSQGAQHISVGSEHPPYNSNPPSSGWHYPNPARTGFYETALPDEQVVHNLEHGEIWIAYHPRLSDDLKNELRPFADDLLVIATPREQNETDLALVAWGRVDALDVGETLEPEEKNRIRDFILRYRNQGPERLPAGAQRR